MKARSGNTKVARVRVSIESGQRNSVIGKSMISYFDNISYRIITIIFNVRDVITFTIILLQKDENNLYWHLHS